MCLLSDYRVSQSKANTVIQVLQTSVLLNLAGKTLIRLPSTGVKSSVMLVAKRMAKRQIVDAMLKKLIPIRKYSP